MNQPLDDVFNRIHELETELERELEKGRKLYSSRAKEKVAEFENVVVEKQMLLRKSVFQFFHDAPLLNILTSPMIYSLLLPLAVMDLWATIYQNICFRAYGMAQVKRSEYVVIDRHHLAYLNWIEAMNCAFCGYANGVITYVREIASRTEQHWCPIKHALRLRDPHDRYHKFLNFGDAEGFRTKLEEYRRGVREK